ncbi:NADH-quinone oxidoreductase subunit NuoF family protein [Actinomadura sp. WMMA1423]|uniref:NADH-quinone oxidoreductase subunit NuoF family protein n=1 Tax=Actinomadura sp. WMMA1423 TaxID=2591108 RepID=UPI0011461EC9|nr:NADH-quinone oxidoreductase subunit NuoF family protein [Actinomadura sp. WMMA1423]
MSTTPRVTAMGRPRLLAGLGRIPRLDAAGHRRVHRVPARLTAGELTALAEQVDLRGRGGAAFPFARKFAAVQKAAARSERPPVVLVNATEGEPASSKDKALLAHVPHLVLAGAMLAVGALRAKELVIGITDEGSAARSLRSALAETGLGTRARVVQLPERFITGESGALVRGVNGETPIPPGRKGRTAESGVDRLPTLLSNAETFAQLAVLAELGAEGYRAVGTTAEPGTVLLTVTAPDGGHIVVETPTGVSLAEVLHRCGTDAGQGVMIGGYHGAWLTPAQAAAATVSRESMEAAGAALGAGIVIPLPRDTCPIGEVARVAAYMGAESAGQCGPCRLGLPAIARSFGALVAGTTGDEALAAIRSGSAIVRGRGACSHPDGTTRFLLSALKVFKDDVDTHLNSGGCGRPTRRVLPIPGEETEEESGRQLAVDWSRCAGHKLCSHLIPDLVELDRFGYPVITRTDVPSRLLRDTVKAAEMCPALALSIRSRA